MAPGMFESHTSASLEDFEHHDRPSLRLRYPSERSGFLREDSSEPGDGSASEGPWSPSRAWRAGSGVVGSGWYRHQPYLAGGAPRSSERSSASREPVSASTDGVARHRSVSIEDPTLLPANIPLPRGSLSPSKEEEPRRFTPKKWSTEPPEAAAGGDQADDGAKAGTPEPSPGLSSYIRFAFRAEVQQRTAPLEWLANAFRSTLQNKPTSVYSIFAVLGAWLLLTVLTRAPIDAPTPDIVKLAGLARSVEPLMYYSERGVQYNTELQETGVAIWDLGESLRAANMSGAPALCRELEELGDSMSGLSSELASYLSAVDGDVDNVLLTMEWARRELSALNAAPQPSPLSSAVSNVHALFNRMGWLESKRTGQPTQAGRLVMYMFGRTPAQRTRAALQATFDEFLTVLEASLDAQLSRAAGLFVYFRRIDEQFKNLQRFTVRELGEQERAEEELLSSLWQRVIGANAHRLRKFERNRNILQAVRGRTVDNKNLLVDHEGKLKALKESLEMLRRRLVGPLLRGAAGSSIASLEEQIRGIDDSHDYLRSVRQSQKTKVMEQIYGSATRARKMEIAGGGR